MLSILCCMILYERRILSITLTWMIYSLIQSYKIHRTLFGPSSILPRPCASNTRACKGKLCRFTNHMKTTKIIPQYYLACTTWKYELNLNIICVNEADNVGHIYAIFERTKNQRYTFLLAVSALSR